MYIFSGGKVFFLRYVELLIAGTVCCTLYILFNILLSLIKRQHLNIVAGGNNAL